MRTSIACAVAGVSGIVLSCSGDRLSGPEAQAAYVQARARLTGNGEGLVVFLDGRQLSPPYDEYKRLDPKQIRFGCTFIGEKARRLHGRRVVLLYTFASSDTGCNVPR